MKYFIFKKEEIKKGDKVKILIRKFHPEASNFEEIVLEEFIVEDFEHYPEFDLYVLNSPANFSDEELKEKVGDSEVIAEIERGSENE